jgi:hypothetical protein
LRSSRETELASEYPVHVAAAWMGNSPAIAAKHYLLVRETDFEKAAQNPAQQQAQRGALAGCVAQATNAIPNELRNSLDSPYGGVETKGLEPSTPALQRLCSPN